MRILFASHYFPPEVNAPSNRTHEHAREDVPPQFIEAEPMAGTRSLESQRKLLVRRVERHDRRTDQRGKDRRQDDGRPYLRHS